MRLAIGLAACATVFTPGALGQVPEGIDAGPWVLAPVWRTSYSYDSNVFRQVGQENGDSVAQLEAGLTATLPFHMSRLRLDYRATRVEYGSNQFKRDLTHNAGVELGLSFRSGDRLTFRDGYRRDIARVAFLDDIVGNEQVFQGEPFSLNRWDIEMERADPGRQGYLIRVRRQDFTYDDATSAGLFEYRGFDNTFEYRQPLTSNRSWTLRYGMRRFNHYDPADPHAGVPFRREETDSLMYGLRGQFGEGQPYQMQLGYGRFRYRQDAPQEYSGLVAVMAWRLAVGGRTGLNFDLVRRPLPSSFDTYYINNALRVDLERRWLRFRTRATARVTLNDYGLSTGGCSGGARQDLTWGLEARQGWKVHERFEIELASFHEQRSSNCDQQDFKATGIEAGVSLGWF